MFLRCWPNYVVAAVVVASVPRVDTVVRPVGVFVPRSIQSPAPRQRHAVRDGIELVTESALDGVRHCLDLATVTYLHWSLEACPIAFLHWLLVVGWNGSTAVSADSFS